MIYFFISRQGRRQWHIYFYPEVGKIYMPKKEMDDLKDYEAEDFDRLAMDFRLEDPYIWFHCSKTSMISYFIIDKLKIGDKEGRWTIEAALLHDIGILDLDWEIRERWPIKPGTMLYDEEWDDILDHPRHSSQIVGRREYLKNILPGIKYHHERWDGYGYPEGLKGEEIPMSARIIAVADMLDSLAAPRNARLIMPIEIALKKIQKEAGAAFDPAVVDAIMQVDKSELTNIITSRITEYITPKELKYYKAKTGQT